MNFQKLCGPLAKSREVSNNIIGHEHIKRLFGLALRSDESNHILLSGPPASAKTMFLMSLRQHVKDSYFVDGGNTTKAGIIDYLFKNRAPYLLIDEIDKMSPRDQTFLFNLMETGIVTETKYGKTRQAEIKTSVFVLRQTEKGLKDNCRVLEERVARCQSVLPLCERIVRLRIGIGELLAFHTDVSEKAEMHHMSMESAAYRVIEDIRDYNKLGGIKKQLSDVTTKAFVMNQFSK